MATVRGRGQAPDLTQLSELDTEARSVQADGHVWTIRLKIRSWDKDSLDILSSLVERGDILDFNVAPLRLEYAYSQLESENRLVA